ncbi:hypothetical protein BDV95DRAFT_586487 [Massariosphaeria phaeospora]|uniref:Uncharacterized protein n=1 Tax=Massariosphaeria phaeospora TaxID=100035 RepID=A0A7C8M1Y1_9PLEO|nr:hypothetical protein BDV95DRAFT_586487 [Massariosphaeria phaeospora]
MNFLVLFALADGLVIRVWRQLLQGTTLSSLHDTYDSANIWPAFKRIIRLQFNVVAVACLLAATSFLRGPLFQRSLTVSENGNNYSSGSTNPATHPQAVYRTDKALVISGIFLSIASVAAIIPLYAGFWDLGRKVSLNPLEIARAFGAPLMETLDGNATADMVTIERGDLAVRYGAVERHNSEKKLRVEMTRTATVRSPWQGEIFG